MTDASVTRTVAEAFGRFAADLACDELPIAVRDHACVLLLDAIGNAFASSTYGFAEQAITAVDELAEGATGPASVIGRRARRPVRDAVLLNGVLVHGLDYDDTHPAALLHASASVAPTALALAEAAGSSGPDLIAAYVAGLEVACRLGASAGAGFHEAGFHPTGLIGSYASAVTAARLRDLDAAGIAQAQGFAHSLASGSLAFLDEGAWTKKVHPGWAGLAGVTSAAFVRAGYPAPATPYEGRYGLFASYLRAEADCGLLSDGLGDTWLMTEIAVKPFPACHFTHAFADAAIALHSQVRPEEIESVHCLIAAEEVPIVCEPWAEKLAPRSSYGAQFSLPYVTAAALIRGRFTLAELDQEAWSNSAVLAVARRTAYSVDAESAFPEAYSGEVVVTTTDGRTLRHREQVNRGAGDRPLSRQDVVAKFRDNAGLAVPASAAAQVEEAVLSLGSCKDVRQLTEVLRPDVRQRIPRTLP